MKAVLHVIVSSAETIGAVNTGFVTVSLHCPTEGTGEGRGEGAARGDARPGPEPFGALTGLGCGDGAGLALGLARRKLPGDAAGGLDARGSFFTGVPAGLAEITLAAPVAIG